MSAPVTFAVRDVSTNQQCIIFLHGFAGTAHATFGMMPAFTAGEPRLQEWDIVCMGYPTGLSPDITGVWSADPDLRSLSAYFSDTVKRYFTRYRKLTIVAHSMGGLIAQRALLDGGFADQVDGLLCYGTPSHGLRKAKLGKLFKRQVRDMDPDSDFIRRLRADWSAQFAPPPFRLSVIAGLRDQFVPPQSSHGPFERSVHVHVLGNHLEMVKPEERRADSFVHLVQHLTGGPSARPSPAPQPSAAGRSIVEQALTLELLGREDDAIALLSAHVEGDLDVRGTLAGRYKRRWLRDPDRHWTDGSAAAALYEETYEEAQRRNDPVQAAYEGINAAFMRLAYWDDPVAAAQLAEQVLPHARASRPDRWASATEAEVRLHLREPARALDLYRKALGVLDLRERAAMLQQAIWTTRLLDEGALESQLEALLITATQI
jgi:pimeloyl-ACP methyl ester carboxylesterase